MDHDDRMAAEELARAHDDLLADEAHAEPEATNEPDIFELELDGQVHTLPAALKGAFLRQADYTRKTQELAEHRRALEGERRAVAEQMRAHEGASQDRVRLAALDHQIAEFEGIDWQGFAHADPKQAETLWRTYEGLAQARSQLATAVAHHEHGRKLQAARENAEAMAETGRALAREIEGWGPDLAHKLTEYAVSHGVTLEELQNAADPRIWKILHRAYAADQASQRDAARRMQTVRPAVSVAGAAASTGGVRDDLGTKEWMRRRGEQVRKGR